jgi:hypothetical protein
MKPTALFTLSSRATGRKLFYRLRNVYQNSASQPFQFSIILKSIVELARLKSMRQVLSGLALLAIVASPTAASADFWARVDRPWFPWEIDRAIAFCRIQPRVNNDSRLFVDLVMGRQIDKCMQALGWIGVAR